METFSSDFLEWSSGSESFNEDICMALLLSLAPAGEFAARELGEAVEELGVRQEHLLELHQALLPTCLGYLERIGPLGGLQAKPVALSPDVDCSDIIGLQRLHGYPGRETEPAKL